MPGKGKRVSDLLGGTVGVCFGTAALSSHTPSAILLWLASERKRFRPPSRFFLPQRVRLLHGGGRSPHVGIVRTSCRARVRTANRLPVHVCGCIRYTCWGKGSDALRLQAP